MLLHAHPTLFVGLGGMGTDVLLRIRREMLLKFGTPALPHHAFVSIDCDRRGASDAAARLEDLPESLRERAALGREELVFAGIDASRLSELLTNLAQYPHLANWLDPSILLRVRSLDCGAGVSRQLGRLAFYEVFPQMKHHLERSISTVRSFDAQHHAQEEFGISVHGDLRVFVFASVAGGTGGGMLLDAAFLLRQILEHNGQDGDIILQLVMPSAFYPTEPTEKMMANAYATLSELEYYSLPKDVDEHVQKRAEQRGGKLGLEPSESDWREWFPPGASKHDFKEYWSGDGDHPGYHRGPSFDSCYLYQGATETASHASLTRVLGDIAQAVFLETSCHPLSERIESVRDGLCPWLGSITRHDVIDPYSDAVISQDVWANLYSSAGIAVVNAPRDRVRFACAYRLGLELLGRLTMQDPYPQPDLHRQIEESFRAGKLQVSGPQYVSALGVDGEGSDYIASTVRPWAAGLEERMRSGADTGGRAAVLQLELVGFQMRALAPKSAPRAEWGELHRLLDVNAFHGDEAAGRLGKRDSLKAELDALVASWLDTNGGIDRTIQRLYALHDVLSKSVLPRLESDRERERSQVQASTRAFSSIIAVLRTEEAAGQRRSAQRLALEAVRHAEQFLSHQVMFEVLDYAVALHRELIDSIGASGPDGLGAGSWGRIPNLTTFRQHLFSVQGAFEAELARYDRTTTADITSELYSRGEYEDSYRDAALDLVQVTSEFYERIGVSADRGSGLMRYASTEGSARLQLSIEEFCLEKCETVGLNLDVVQELFRQPDRDDGVGRFIRASAPRVRGSGQARANVQIQRAMRQTYMLAYDRSGVVEPYEWFRWAAQTELSREPFASFAPKDIATPYEAGSVLMYCANAAFPLAYIDEVARCREAYFAAIHGDSRREFFPHLDTTAHSFPDICFVSDAESMLRHRCERARLLAKVLGIALVGDGGANSPASARHFVRWLMQDPSGLERLEADVDRARSALEREHVLRYAAVVRWLEENSFPQRYVMSPVGVTQAFSPEREILCAEFDSLAERIMSFHDGDTETAKSALDALVREIDDGAGTWFEPVDIDGVAGYRLAPPTA
jgi:hypothetical protein